MINKEIKDITNKYLAKIFEENNFQADERFWKNYNNKKSKALFKLFGDELIIEKEVEFNMSSNELKEDIRKTKLADFIKEHLTDYWKNICEEQDASSSEARLLISELTSNIDTLVNNKLFSSYRIKTENGKKVTLLKDSKVTRLLKHFMNEKDLNEFQVKYSQLVNRRTIKGVLCLSIHPLDYLTVSVNNSGWSSCFNTKTQGEYCSSTLCLINSPNTMVAYLKGDKNVRYFGKNGAEPVVWNNKRWRTLVTVGKINEEEKAFHVGKQYPYESNSLRDEVSIMMGELMKGEFTGHKKGEEAFLIYTPEIMYNDASIKDFDVYYTKEWADKYLSKDIDHEKVSISHYATCPVCGEDWECGPSDTLCCPSCQDCDMCEICGDPIPQGEYVCLDCSYTAGQCQECGAFMREDELSFVRDGVFLVGLCDCCESQCEIGKCKECGESFVKEEGNEELCVVCKRKEGEREE